MDHECAFGRGHPFADLGARGGLGCGRQEIAVCSVILEKIPVGRILACSSKYRNESFNRRLGLLSDGGALLDDEAMVFDCRGFPDCGADFLLEVIRRET